MTPTVLLVDDEPNIIYSLKRALRKETYQLLGANSGREALEILSRQTIDVIISDERMPGMSGTEFLSLVSEKYPDSIRIILTGNADVDMAIRAINEGKIYRFLKKPCHEIEIAATIQEALKQREFLLKTRRLLQLYKQKTSVLDQLEQKFPGISEVKKDSSGVIVIDEEPVNFRQLMTELGNELKKNKFLLNG